VLANFLIGLREGLEASLIVGILVAYTLKTGSPRLIHKILTGTALAVLVSILVGLALAEFVAVVPQGTNEIISGLASIAAMGFVTWMIFWMSKQSRNLKSGLQEKIDNSQTKTYTLVTVAFLAVIREGIETSVFIWSASRATGADTYPVVGAALGLVVSAVLGYLVYRGSLKLNLATFFKYTGAFLIIVAAGILAYGVGELQQIGWLNFLNATAYDLTGMIPIGSTLDTLLRGTISFKSAPTVLVSLTWLSYVVIVGRLYLRPKNRTN
jgi:high-affinity iron transporter